MKTPCNSCWFLATNARKAQKTMSLLSVEDALDRVVELCVPLAAEQVSIDAAMGRVLAHDVTATRSLPPWDNSAMDGYAIRTADLSQLPAQLTIVERIFAGQEPSIPLDEGMCSRIMTGAQIPKGADAVVMQERVKIIDDDVIELGDEVPAGTHIRRRGEDIVKGAPLFEAGTFIGLAECGALWAQSISSVMVHRRPRVAIAASGDELCNAWEEPRGRIVDSNSPVIAAAVRQAGGVPVTLGVVPDQLESLIEIFQKGLDADVLITIAGASVGERDFTKDAFKHLGVEMDFWKVAMKPGKPLAVGTKGSTLVIGLPGNPISAMVTFELFVRPALRSQQGLKSTPLHVPGRAAAPLSKSPGLRHFVRVSVENRDGELWATPTRTQSSGALSSAFGATHLASLAPELADIPEGGAIDLIPLSWSS